MARFFPPLCELLAWFLKTIQGTQEKKNHTRGNTQIREELAVLTQEKELQQLEVRSNQDHFLEKKARERKKVQN